MSKKYVHFVDMHNDDCGGTFEVTEAEFKMLEPYRADMNNCNPLPSKLSKILWDKIYSREQADVNPDTLTDKDIIVQTIC